MPTAGLDARPVRRGLSPAVAVAAGDVAIVRMTEQPPIASWYVATRQGERDDVVRSFARELGERAKEVFEAARRR